MDEVRYGITREFPDVPYEEAVTRITEAIAAEGFGVLTEIDVKAIMKKKLDVDFRKYVIGLLLPCNVVVMERDGGGSVVSAIQPEVQFTLVDQPGLSEIAGQVKEKLERALESIS